MTSTRNDSNRRPDRTADHSQQTPDRSVWYLLGVLYAGIRFLLRSRDVAAVAVIVAALLTLRRPFGGDST